MIMHSYSLVPVGLVQGKLKELLPYMAKLNKDT